MTIELIVTVGILAVVAVWGWWLHRPTTRDQRDDAWARERARDDLRREANR